MAKFIVTTDSGCDLPADVCKERGIYAYRMKYTIGNQEFEDDMSPDGIISFYNKMREGAVPRTSQMTPLEFINFWSQLYEATQLPIVHIAMGSGISGTFANGLIAQRMFLEKYPSAQIFVLDSTLASIGYGMLCLWAAEMRDAGETAEACVELLNERKLYINTYYTTDDLQYLQRSGRLSKVGATVAGALQINPILNLDKDGHLVVRERIRGRKKAFQRIYDIVQELAVRPQEQIVYICHSDCRPEDVEMFKNSLLEKIGFKDAFISYIGAIIGSHSGPGLIAAFFLGKARTI